MRSGSKTMARPRASTRSDHSKSSEAISVSSNGSSCQTSARQDDAWLEKPQSGFGCGVSAVTTRTSSSGAPSGRVIWPFVAATSGSFVVAQRALDPVASREDAMRREREVDRRTGDGGAAVEGAAVGERCGARSGSFDPRGAPRWPTCRRSSPSRRRRSRAATVCARSDSRQAVSVRAESSVRTTTLARGRSALIRAPTFAECAAPGLVARATSRSGSAGRRRRRRC